MCCGVVWTCGPNSSLTKVGKAILLNGRGGFSDMICCGNEYEDIGKERKGKGDVCMYLMRLFPMGGFFFQLVESNPLNPDRSFVCI